MPLYREDSYLVVHPGSSHTIFSFGLLDLASPPQYKIPSVVYQDLVSKEYRSKRDENEPNLVEIRPIVRSRIVDVDAFNHLLKVILLSVILKHPIVTINQIPLLLVAPSVSWSRAAVELITKYVFEALEFTAFNIIDLSIASTFGIGSSTSAVVVNVGHDAVQVLPVLGYQGVKFAGRYLPGVGGRLINEELARLLPSLLETQIEALKTSHIYEVLNTHEGTYYSLADLNKDDDNDDEAFDVAKLVADSNGNDIKPEGEEAEEDKPNSELEKNFFLDPETSEKIYVGKERFQGTSQLVAHISDAIFDALSAVPDLEKRQECYDNLIFVGSTFKISGLKHAVLIKLSHDYLVRHPNDLLAKDDSNGVNSAILAYQTVDEVHDLSGDVGPALTQVPTSVKAARYPDYFPEWKKPKDKGGSWEDVYFLGSEIYAKQIFGANSNHGGDSFIDTDIYEDRGPSAIWDVSL